VLRKGAKNIKIGAGLGEMFCMFFFILNVQTNLSDMYRDTNPYNNKLIILI